MNSRFAIGMMGFAAVAGIAQGQTQQQRAAITGGGNQNQGRCTVEVVVDGAAEVDLRGDTATLRNLKGQMPQWRRFECTSPMPSQAADFRFQGVNGRGSQQLMRDPRNGGTAVVQIQDPDNGSDTYKFDITWGGNGGGQPAYQDRNRQDYNRSDARDGDRRDFRDDRGNPDRRGDRDGNYRQSFSRDDAMRGCQDAVRQQAAQQFDATNIMFRRLQADDNPGGRDRVDGVFDARRRNGRDEAFRFSCSVNLESGRVWNAQISPFDRDRDRR